MKRRIIIFIAIALIIALQGMLFAAGSQDSKAGAAKVSLRYMWWGNEVRNNATVAMTEAYEELNPGITIETEPNPYDGYHDKIIIQLSSGTAPDVFCFSTQWLAEAGYSSTPLLYNLHELSDRIDLSTFNPSLVSAGEIKGKLLGLPTGISGWVYYYSINTMQAFAEKSGAGMPPAIGTDWTYEEFIEYGSKLRDVMGDDYALMVVDKEAFTHYFLSILSELAGGFYMNPNATLNFTRDNFVDTLQLFQRLTDEGILPKPSVQIEGMSSSDMSTTVATGLYPMLYEWTSVITATTTMAESEQDIMAYPKIGRDEFDGVFIRPAQFWSIAAATDHPNEAADFLNFIVNDPVSIKELGLVRSVPPTEAGQQVLAEAGELVGPTYEGTAYLTREADASFNPFVLLPELEDVLRAEYSKFITGQKSVEATADKILGQWEKILDTLRTQSGIE